MGIMKEAGKVALTNLSAMKPEDREIYIKIRVALLEAFDTMVHAMKELTNDQSLMV